MLKNFYVLIMLSQKVAEKARVMEIENVDADLGHHAGELIFFRLSLGFSYELDDDFARARAIVEIEQDDLLPSAKQGWPFSMGIAIDGPKSEARRWEKPLSSPQRSS